MIWIFLVARLEGDFGVTIVSPPFCNGGSCVGFSCHGAAASRSRATDDDVNLLLDRSLWPGRGSPFSVLVLIGRDTLISDVLTKMALSDEILNLVLQVMAFLHVVVIFSVETIISPLITSLGFCPDRIRGPEEPLASNLEEDLCTRRIKGCGERLTERATRTLRLAGVPLLRGAMVPGCRAVPLWVEVTGAFHLGVSSTRLVDVASQAT
ncbi:hypothetical protein B296_00029565 [Ensete ventricosum]|uniref:Uncharacterized protein n=1 Tax=Ensete ventricosum TaxID=4639 RepID=A0A427AKR1_ENSVE|nr:hypothetical protein B296_00029565 [Ensete ventricosum]